MQRNRNSRRRRRPAYRRRHRLDLRRFVPFLCFLTIFVVSASMLGNYIVRSAHRKSDNIQMAQNYENAFMGREAVILAADGGSNGSVPADATVSPDVSAAPTSTPAPTATPAPTLLDTYREFSGDIPSKASKLYIQNSDLVGWLYIKGVVSLPVVQRDNSYYLTHNFAGEEDSGGTLFLDEYHPMSESLQHLLIHGHNMHDSSMFGIVSTYEKLSVAQSNGFASFSTMYAPEDYVLYAVLRVSSDVSDDGYFSYVGTPNFYSEDDFYAFAAEVKDRSMYDIPIDVEPSDALLSLSTCIGDDRLLVCFRRFRDGETKDSLQPLLNQIRKK